MPIDSTSSIPARRFGPSPWNWMILACAIIAISGAIRVNQESQFADAAHAAETSPFPIRDLPRDLGDHWKMYGDEQYLEEETLQIAGCSDYLFRTYVDNRTGVTLTVLVAFGPAERIFPHSPIVCFPANGYQRRGGPWRRIIRSDDTEPAGFNALVYGKSGGGVDELREVYYSFRHDGQWSPDAEQTRQQFRHRPAMFKIQVERPIVPGEAGSKNSPIEDFIAALLPEIEQRLAAIEDRVEG